MTNIIVNGIFGKMGRAIVNAAPDNEVYVACGKDLKAGDLNGIKVYDSLYSATEKFDCMIDFTHHNTTVEILEFSVQKKLPLVIATTGQTPDEIEMIKSAAKHIPIFYSRNMSVGVNVVMRLAKAAALMLGDDFDVEIIEMHHNKKVDAPSGTAFMIADQIKNVKADDYFYKYDRTTEFVARNKNEIGIHSVRGGTIIGEHEVIFSGNGETVKISHSAQSRELFAEGALRAAKYIKNKTPALYNMEKMLAEIAAAV